MADLEIEVRIEPLLEPEGIEEAWRGLELRCADPSFFRSWTWIGSWLTALPDRSAIRVISLRAGHELVGLGIVGCRTFRRHGLLRVRGLFLNETGDPSLDTLTVEHNGLLLEANSAPTLIAPAIRELEKLRSWDELSMSGIEQRTLELYRAALPTPGCRLVTRNEKPYFKVDLDELRTAGVDYLSRLSANTRSQIRRSIREYEARGPLSLRIAADEEEAIRHLDQLRALHQAYWNQRGVPGAFATDFANSFHAQLIARGMPRGEIQISEITCADEVVGYLYNFVYGGVVSNYQSGFDYTGSGKLKPGLVSHYLSIQENLRLGARVYDFLMGDHRYKKSLSTIEGRMSQLVVQRKKLVFGLEDAARHLVGRFRH